MGKGTGETGEFWVAGGKQACMCQHCMTWRAPPPPGEQRDSSNSPESGSSITGKFMILPELSVPMMGCVCAFQHLYTLIN